MGAHERRRTHPTVSRVLRDGSNSTRGALPPGSQKATPILEGEAAQMTATSDIVLATLNARYIHSAFGLRCLQANLGELQSRSQILEFTIKTRALDVAESMLAASPQIVGLGVYVWNTAETLAVVRLLRCLRPRLIIVLGGPEISHEWQEQPLFELADHVIQGEGEIAFADLCRRRLDGDIPDKLIAGGLPDLASLVLPYSLYTDADIASRVLYVEASRGCPFRCAFCLSALDKKVRSFAIDDLLEALVGLIERGARRFKFVDRTFNLSPRSSEAILRFFLPHMAKGVFLHFEMVPDRFPEALRELIAAFPAGSVQLEVGIQTLAPAIATRIDRPQDNEAVFQNVQFLIEHTGVHVHADLIVGLPGEDMDSFGGGFDGLRATGVHEIQVGMLKRLRGAPIARHTDAWAMLYSPLSPYEVLSTGAVSAEEMARLRRFARYWDVVGNSGRFRETLPLLLGDGSPFQRFIAFADWLHESVGRTHELAFKRCVEALFDYLVSERRMEPAVVAAALASDYRRVSRKSHVPAVLQGLVEDAAAEPADERGHLPGRQRRHE